MWHLQTSTCVRRGTCGGIYSTFLCLFGVACVALLALGWVWQRALALGDIDVPFAWQAWPLGASTLVSRGRRGTYGTGLSTFTRDFVRQKTLSQATLSHTHTTLSYVQLWHTELFHRHLLCLSFLPRPASTSVSNYWKKLTFGVIRSFFFWFSNSFCQLLPHGV